jgi:lysophospholipase L1-like esterase
MQIFSIAVYFCLLNIHPAMQDKKFRYLALGDSYTIGEGVPAHQNFPAQTIRVLSRSGMSFEDPVIIAKTGWTTDELVQGIAAAKPDGTYDIVSLLIGVNNQYRGRPVNEYNEQFEKLLKMAIQFAGGKADRVFVLSIPDWSATPFGSAKQPERITKEIDEFNSVNKKISEKYKVNYIEITQAGREALKDPELVTGDQLHPSGKEYAKWATKLADAIRKKLNHPL